MKNNRLVSTREMTLVGLFVAVTAALAQVSIPVFFSPVPITGQTFAVMLAGAILGSRLGALSMAVYVLLGAFGAPIFAQAKAGFGVLVGPTGGYLFGFILGAYLLGKVVEAAKGEASYLRVVVGMILCTLVVYILGVSQLAFVLKFSLAKALTVGAIPYLPMDALKLVLAAGVAVGVRRSLQAAGFLAPVKA